MKNFNKMIIDELRDEVRIIEHDCRSGNDDSCQFCDDVVINASRKELIKLLREVKKL